jgi:hAT family C-terminal dimerisation region
MQVEYDLVNLDVREQIADSDMEKVYPFVYRFKPATSSHYFCMLCKEVCHKWQVWTIDCHTNYRKHHENWHGEEFSRPEIQVDAGYYTGPSRVSSWEKYAGPKHLSDEEKMRIHDKCADWLVIHALPFSIVDHKEFREYSHMLNAEYVPHTRHSISEYIMNRWRKSKELVAHCLEATLRGKRFCMTVDLWSSASHEGYMAVTLHYIQPDWTTKSLVASLVKIPTPHSGEKMAESLIDSLNELSPNLLSSIWIITADNASANVAMVRAVNRILKEKLSKDGEQISVEDMADEGLRQMLFTDEAFYNDNADDDSLYGDISSTNSSDWTSISSTDKSNELMLDDDSSIESMSGNKARDGQASDVESKANADENIANNNENITNADKNNASTFESNANADSLIVYAKAMHGRAARGRQSHEKGARGRQRTNWHTIDGDESGNDASAESASGNRARDRQARVNSDVSSKAGANVASGKTAGAEGKTVSAQAADGRAMRGRQLSSMTAEGCASGARGRQSGAKGARGRQSGDKGARGRQLGAEGARGRQSGAKGARGRQSGAKGARGRQSGAKGARGRQLGAEGARGRQLGAEGARGRQSGDKGARGRQSGAKGARGRQLGAEGARGRPVRGDGAVGENVSNSQASASDDTGKGRQESCEQARAKFKNASGSAKTANVKGARHEPERSKDASYGDVGAYDVSGNNANDSNVGASGGNGQQSIESGKNKGRFSRKKSKRKHKKSFSDGTRPPPGGLDDKVIFMRCCAHIIALAIKYGLTRIHSVSSIISHIRRLVAKIHESIKLKELLEDCCKIVGCKFTLPSLDVDTRWNSTYVMLMSVMKVKDAINILLLTLQKQQKGSNTFCIKPTSKLCREIPERRWNTLALFCSFLQPFDETTTRLSSASYPTLSLVLPAYTFLVRHAKITIRFARNKKEKVLHAFAVAAWKKLCMFKRLLNQPQLKLATLLDPRTKSALHDCHITQSEVARLFVGDWKGHYKAAFEMEKQQHRQHDLQQRQRNHEQHNEIPSVSFFSKVYNADETSDNLCNELTHWFQLPGLQPDCPAADVISWMQFHAPFFPRLSRMAYDYLGAAGTSVASERAFSCAGLVVSKLRTRLMHQSVRAICELKSYLSFLGLGPKVDDKQC